MFTRANNYSKYLANNLPKYNFIENYDGFNLSFIQLDDKSYLFCVRCIALIPAFFGEELIPGNYSNKEDFILTKKIENVKFGKNFIWNNWTEDYLDNIILFVGQIKNMHIIPNKDIKPIAYQNIPIFYKGQKTNFKYSDIRLFKSNNKILMYDGFVSAIHEIAVVNKKIYTSIIFKKNDNFYKQYKFYFNRRFCDEIREYDKNWSYIEDIQKKGEVFMTFLNWYEKGNVSMTSISNTKCIKNFIIKMNKDLIYGNDKDFTLGMFSFGVPFKKINQDNKNFKGISVGHIKIPYLNQKYEENPNIASYLNKIKDLNIIRHNSYDYLIYFIYLERNNETYSMKISDAILLIDISQKYSFSINYPMAIECKNNDVIISMGVGDFYTYLYKLSYSDFISQCIHDVSNFSIKKYKYIIKQYSTSNKFKEL